MTLISDARHFLSELSENNNRDWFKANKDRYDATLKGPALALLDQTSADLTRLTDLPVKTKLFRPQRDTRFSKDKTPYHLHLHMLWNLSPQAAQSPAFFLGISPDYISVGGGMMQFDKASLLDWRAAVDQQGDSWSALLDTMVQDGWDIREPDLKRVPAPFDKTHAHGDLLRRKGLSAWREIPDDNLHTQMQDAFAALWPLQQKLIALF